MNPDDYIQTIIRKIPLDNVIYFDNGWIGQRITIEEYDHFTQRRDDRIEEGGIPFRNLATGELFLVPGGNEAQLKPVVPKAFTDAWDSEVDE